MVRLRLDRRLQGRLDPSDVLQEAYLDFARRLPDYAREPTMPLYLWLRFLTGQRLIDLHRQHLGTQMRDAGQEASLYRGALPQASSVSLAAQLLGKLTSVSRAEMQIRVQEALNSMDPMDLEVLALRHFEMLSTRTASASVRWMPSTRMSVCCTSTRRGVHLLRTMCARVPGGGDFRRVRSPAQVASLRRAEPGAHRSVGCRPRRARHRVAGADAGIGLQEEDPITDILAGVATLCGIGYPDALGTRERSSSSQPGSGVT